MTAGAAASIRWLKDQGWDVVELTIDLGEKKDLDAVQERALKIGASAAYVVDGRRQFVEGFVWPTLQTGALYEKEYPLATAIGRPLIAALLVQIARQEGAVAIAHGCTGKGNDQVRFELGYYALEPDIRVVAPWREWNFASREQLLHFAEQHQIPISNDKRGEAPFSIDANLLHSSSEGKVLEDPALEAPEHSLLGDALVRAYGAEARAPIRA